MDQLNHLSWTQDPGAKWAKGCTEYKRRTTQVQFTITTVHVDLHKKLDGTIMTTFDVFTMYVQVMQSSVGCPQTEQRQSMASELISGQG